MTARSITALAFFLCIGLVSSPSAQDGRDHPEREGPPPGTERHPRHEPGLEEAHGIVRLSDEDIEDFGIAVETAGPGIIESHIELPGEVRPNADRLAHIVPRYAGIVIGVDANIGDLVERGQVLATVESNESLAPFEVRTLISGTVIGKHITLGEAVSRDTDAFIIADLSDVWIDLTVYQRDLARVKPGLEARVHVGHDAVRGTGAIGYVTPVVDERTRTATARLVLDNEDHRWLPGTFVTARVVVDRASVPVAVPRSAVHTVSGDAVVFLDTGDGFRPRTVSLGRRDAARVEVLSGLSAGDRYVSRGGFTLKAELGKGSFGHGHGH